MNPSAMIPNPLRRTPLLLGTLAVLLLAPLPVFADAEAAQPAEELSPVEGYRLVQDLMVGERGERKRAARRLLEARDLSLVPAMVDALFFVPDHARETLLDTLRELTGENPGTGYYDWVEVVGRREDLAAKERYLEWKVALLSRIDPEYRKILYPGAPTDIRPEEIVWGGVKVGGIPALDDPPRVSATEAEGLSDGEEVFGVSFGGEHHAYPLRYLSWHEMANDVIGGQAFVLSF